MAVQHPDGPRHVGDLALDGGGGQTALAPSHDHEPLRIRPARDANQERIGNRPTARAIRHALSLTPGRREPVMRLERAASQTRFS